eukprot:m.195554 g.195554  ORF g.195554 m.195554 type:complete len:783 (+) comp15459_c10_seq7:68-2416(+)
MESQPLIPRRGAPSVPGESGDQESGRDGRPGIVRGLVNRASKMFHRGHYDVAKAQEEQLMGAEYRDVRGSSSGSLDGEDDTWADEAESPAQKKPNKILNFFGMDEQSQQQLKQVNLYDYPDTDSESDSDDDSSIALWQHGNITNMEAEQRLRAHGCGNGLFLVRRERLYLCCDDRIHVYPIVRSKAGVALRGLTVFKSLPALITNYSLLAQELPCLLGRPCPPTSPSTDGSAARVSGIAGMATTSLLDPHQSASYYQNSNPPNTTPSLGRGPSTSSTSAAAAAAMSAHAGDALCSSSLSSSIRPSVSLAPPPPPRASDSLLSSSNNSSHNHNYNTTATTGAGPSNASHTRNSSSSSGGGGGGESGGKSLTPEEREREKRIRRLRSLPVFKPHFTYLVCLIQIAILVAEIVQGGMMKVGFTPTTDMREVDTGFANMTLSTLAPFNFYIGPNPRYLVGFGAKYSPCMRKDTVLAVAAAQQRAREASDYGCCLGAGGRCGVTLSADCTGVWEGQTLVCPADRCPNIVLRPCCTGVNGTCLITSQDHCAFLSGVWLSSAQRCGDVDCLPESCKFGLETGSTPNQWYRLITSIFIHAGIIHLFVVVLMQYFLGCQIERAIGFLRIALVYLIAGIGGNLTSAFFAPSYPQLGATGAIHGLLAINIVDLFQSWSFVEKPVVRLVKLLMEVLLYFGLGFLPWIGNWQHLGGLVFGLMAAVVFVPHITFGKWHRVRRVCLVLLMLPILVVSFLAMLILFYNVQNTDFCGVFCEYMQCIPFTEAFCGQASLL